MTETPKVLFVCLGNICRSPMAEGAFLEEARREAVAVVADSAGLHGWHVGRPPDRRAQAVALKNGVDIGDQRARTLTAEDFREFTHVVAMDHDILKGVKKMAPKDGTAQISLFLDHAHGRAGQAVPDPYYGEDAAFEETWADVVEGSQGLIRAFKPD